MATGNAPRGFPRILQWLLAGLMLIIGLAVGILGAKLALVGGTLYFALMGVVMVIAAVLIFRNRRGGILLPFFFNLLTRPPAFAGRSRGRASLRSHIECCR